MRPLGEDLRWLMNLGWALGEMYEGWKVVLAWNFAVAALLAAGEVLGPYQQELP